MRGGAGENRDTSWSDGKGQRGEMENRKTMEYSQSRREKRSRWS